MPPKRGAGGKKKSSKKDKQSVVKKDEKSTAVPETQKPTVEEEKEKDHSASDITEPAKTEEPKDSLLEQFKKPWASNITVADRRASAELTKQSGSDTSSTDKKPKKFEVKQETFFGSGGRKTVAEGPSTLPAALPTLLYHPGAPREASSTSPTITANSGASEPSKFIPGKLPIPEDSVKVDLTTGTGKTIAPQLPIEVRMAQTQGSGGPSDDPNNSENLETPVNSPPIGSTGSSPVPPMPPSSRSGRDAPSPPGSDSPQRGSTLAEELGQEEFGGESAEGDEEPQDAAALLAHWDRVAELHSPARADFENEFPQLNVDVIDRFLERLKQRPLPGDVDDRILARMQAAGRARTATQALSAALSGGPSSPARVPPVPSNTEESSPIKKTEDEAAGTTPLATAPANQQEDDDLYEASPPSSSIGAHPAANIPSTQTSRGPVDAEPLDERPSSSHGTEQSPKSDDVIEPPGTPSWAKRIIGRIRGDTGHSEDESGSNPQDSGQGEGEDKGKGKGKESEPRSPPNLLSRLRRAAGSTGTGTAAGGTPGDDDDSSDSENDDKKGSPPSPTKPGRSKKKKDEDDSDGDASKDSGDAGQGGGSGTGGEGGDTGGDPQSPEGGDKHTSAGSVLSDSSSEFAFNRPGQVVGDASQPPQFTSNTGPKSIRGGQVVDAPKTITGGAQPKSPTQQPGPALKLFAPPPTQKHTDSTRERRNLFQGPSAQTGPPPVANLREELAHNRRQYFDPQNPEGSREPVYFADPETEEARQRLAVETAAARNETPEEQRHQARNYPHSIVEWRIWAKSQKEESPCIERANAAIDDALEIGTEQSEELIRCRAHAKKLEDEMKELKTALDGRGGQGYMTSGVARGFLEDIQEELNERDQRIDDADYQIDTNLGNYQEAKNETAEIEKEKRKAEKERDAALIRAGKADAEVAKLKDDLKAIETDLQNSINRKTQLTDDLKAAKDKLKETEEDFQRYKHANNLDESELRTEILNVTKQRDLEIRTKEAVAKLNQNSRAKVDEQIRTIKQLESEKADLEVVQQEALKTQARNAELEGEVQDLRAILTATEQGYDAQLYLTTLQGMIKDLQDENEKIRKDVQKGTRTDPGVDNKELKLNLEKALDMTVEDKYAHNLSVIQSTIDEDRRYKRKLEQDKDNLELENAELKQQVYNLREQLEDLGRDNQTPGDGTGTSRDTESTQDLAKLEQENIKLRGIVTKLREELKRKYEREAQELMDQQDQYANEELLNRITELETRLEHANQQRDRVENELGEATLALAERDGEIHLKEREKQLAERNLDIRIRDLTQQYGEKARENSHLQNILTSKLLESIVEEEKFQWDDREHHWVAPEIVPEVAEQPLDNTIEWTKSAPYIDVGLLRVQIALLNLVTRRASHGLQDGDGDQAVEIAQEAVNDASEVEDPMMRARAHFWLALAQYYNNDVHSAKENFEESGVDDGALPEYEYNILDDWLVRVQDDPPATDPAAYGGREAGPTREEFIEREQYELKKKIEEAKQRKRDAARDKKKLEKAQRKAARAERRSKKDKDKKEQKRKQKRGDDTAADIPKGSDDSDSDPDFPGPAPGAESAAPVRRQKGVPQGGGETKTAEGSTKNSSPDDQATTASGVGDEAAPAKRRKGAPQEKDGSKPAWLSPPKKGDPYFLSYAKSLWWGSPPQTKKDDGDITEPESAGEDVEEVEQDLSTPRPSPRKRLIGLGISGVNLGDEEPSDSSETSTPTPSPRPSPPPDPEPARRRKAAIGLGISGVDFGDLEPEDNSETPALEPKKQYYINEVGEAIEWDGEEFESDSDDPIIQINFDPKPIPDPNNALTYNTGLECDIPGYPVFELSERQRILNGGLRDDEEIPTAEELMGEHGFGEQLQPEGSEMWLYGQRILDDVRRRLREQEILRDARLTKEAIAEQEQAADEAREKETEAQRGVREIGETAQQAYIRDQEFWGKPIVHEEMLMAGVMARQRWAKFLEEGKKYAAKHPDLFTEEKLHQRSFHWVDTRLLIDAAEKRAHESGEALNVLEERLKKWVEFNVPITPALRDALKIIAGECREAFGYEKAVDV